MQSLLQRISNFHLTEFVEYMKRDVTPLIQTREFEDTSKAQTTSTLDVNFHAFQLQPSGLWITMVRADVQESTRRILKTAAAKFDVDKARVFHVTPKSLFKGVRPPP